MWKIQNPLKLMSLAFVFGAALPVGSNAQVSNCEACIALYEVCLNTCTINNNCFTCDPTLLLCIKNAIAEKKKSKK